METIAEFAARAATMSIFELRATRRDQGRLIADTERAGELVDLDEWRVLDALDAELNARKLTPAEL